MGVTYKLREDVVRFIISQRQNNPLFSCRQLAESVSQQFGIRLSKSSVHDVLKESGAVTPRGRKPKDKFQIPIEKKKQIQVSLSQASTGKSPRNKRSYECHCEPAGRNCFAVKNTPRHDTQKGSPPLQKEDIKEADPLQKGDVYEGAGRIFLKAALWDLGVFSEDDIKEDDWKYYLHILPALK